jgi:heme-degrading monooxygenase HmoA
VFIQVIQGQVRHAEPVYVELDQWIKELSGSAQGWLGSTAGVTDDKRFITLSRWESEEAARRNSARPEQDHWWRSFSELFTDPPTFHESSDIMLDINGDPDHARFVQVMQGRGTNPGRARELMGSHSDEWAAFRPEVLGSVGCMYDDGAYTMAIYFTDEASAREGERKQPPPELQADMDEMNTLSVGEPEFFDLRAPWLHSR